MLPRTPAPLAARLRFAVDDYAEAGRTFAAWREHGRDADLEQVQLWTYSYIRRYLIAQFLRERTGGPSDLEETLTRAFERAFRNFERVRDPALFPHYVSVIAKRELLTYRGRRRLTVEYDETLAEGDDPVDAGESIDRPFVQQTVAAAIDALPASLREIARWRLLEQRSYEEIAELTGHPLPTVRTYLSKAASRLREHPGLRMLYSGDPDDA